MPEPSVNSPKASMNFNVLNHPVIFSFPRRLTDVTAWHGLIPVAFALIALHRPRVFVELGTHKGDSYCAFCQAVDELGLPTRCYAVDTWQGDPHAGFYGEDVYQELRAYHDPLYGRFSSLLRMTFDEALGHFAEAEIDLLHIDGLHAYEAVKHDFESWLPKMSPQGVMVFHDIAVHEGDFGVWRLWQELGQRYPTRCFGFSHGLGLVAVGPEVLTGGLGVWFTAQEEEWLSIQTLFAALGERLRQYDQVKSLQSQLADSRRELTQAAAQIAKEHQAWQRWNQEKADEIIALQEALQAQRAELEQAKALQAELEAEVAKLKRAESARDVLGEILNSWFWRGLGRYVSPIAEAVIVETLPTVELGESAPLTLPNYVWPRSGKSLGGMRKLLMPLEILGDRVVSQENLLISQIPGGRLLVRLSEPLKAVKLVLGVAEPCPMSLTVEFGELEGKTWCAFVRHKARILPGWPCVLYLSLPKPAAMLALCFSHAGQVRFSQIAVFAVNPLECALGPWLKPLQQGMALLRSRPRQRLERAIKRYGWRGTIEVARQRFKGNEDALPELPVVNQKGDGQDPYAYLAAGKEADLAGQRIAVLVSSCGNSFMREIAKVLAQGAEKLGAEVILGGERDKVDHAGFDWLVVVAPHEFFTLGKGVGRFSQFARHRLLLVNTEQPQTQWFRTAWEFFSSARAVLDINYQTAIHLRQLGIRSYFLPLGYVPAAFPEEFPHHSPFFYLPRAVLERAPSSYQERPLDIVFVGTASPRRKLFFARHAEFFAGLETFIYLPEGDRPFVPGDPRTLDFATLSGLIRRAKIVLNLHRDEHPYLEWQRIVQLGILQKTLVISEHCDFCPALRANKDYLDLPLDLIPTVCAYYLTHLDEAERFAQRAFSRIRDELPMDKVLSRLFAALEMP